MLFYLGTMFYGVVKRKVFILPRESLCIFRRKKEVHGSAEYSQKCICYMHNKDNYEMYAARAHLFDI